MISFEHWAKARDEIKQHEDSFFRPSRLRAIDAAIRSGNAENTLQAIEQFRGTHAGGRGMAKYDQLLDWLQGNIDVLTQDNPDEDTVQNEIYQLHPYSIPPTWELQLDDESVARWNSSIRPVCQRHTFIAVTNRGTGLSSIYPCFMLDSTETRVFNPGIPAPAGSLSFDVVNRVVETGGEPPTEERRVPTRIRAIGRGTHSIEEVDSIYGSSGRFPNAIILPYQENLFSVAATGGRLHLMWSIDGMFHKEACRRSGNSEMMVIGWSIKGSKLLSSGEIRFVSGRNYGKFRTEFKRNDHESRDMPEAYASAISQMVANALALTLAPNSTFSTSGRGRRSRCWIYQNPFGTIERDR